MSGWPGGSGLFFVLFFEMQKGPMWVIVSHCFVFFRRFLELGGHFFGDFGVLGSSLDAFGAWGGPGSRPCRNSPLQWSSFGLILELFLE